MCGRYALTHSPESLENALGAVVEAFPPRFNIAPTQPILVVTSGPRRDPGSNQPDRAAMLVRWGFIPDWARDAGQFPLLINARSETAASKASFRAAMRHRRVLIPASGFYEWKRGGRKIAQPYWVRPRDGGVVAFGGLMETHSEPGGAEIDTAAILTCPANTQIAHIHDRMPVVVRPEHFERWLDCVNNEPRDVADIMYPVDPGFFDVIPVSEKVNKVANTGPDIQETAEVPEPSGKTPPQDQLDLF